MKKTYLILLTGMGLLMACADSPEEVAKKQAAADAAESQQLEQEIGPQARAMFRALPESAPNPANPITAEKVRLGKILYFDKRLSKDGTQSCNSCHNMETYGVDNLAVSPGDNGGFGVRNSPTVLNSAFHATQFWDGRAKDVEEQAAMPITNPIEMGMASGDMLVERLAAVDLYKKMFSEVYPDQKEPVTFQNIAGSIAAFERTLITPARWDDYLNGDANALTLAEKRGLKTYINAGCATCHNGQLMGGNMFQKFGVYANYWEHTKSGVVDEGRFTVTENEADRHLFKVPSLRNITETHPYFHDGSVAQLNDAVRIMAKVNLNKDLSETEVTDIVTFLGALKGEVTPEMSSMPKELLEAQL